MSFVVTLSRMAAAPVQSPDRDSDHAQACEQDGEDSGGDGPTRTHTPAVIKKKRKKNKKRYFTARSTLICHFHGYFPVQEYWH